MPKRLYRLSIVFDDNDEECDSLCETIDIIDGNEDMLTITDYANKDIREALIEAQVMGDA